MPAHASVATMPTIERSVTTSTSPETVFAYLADFENATEWDHGTVACKRISGGGEVGSVYRNESKFMGTTVTLDYTLEEDTPPVVRLVGRNKSTESIDTMRITPDGTGTRVDYSAEFTFSGASKLLAPLLAPFLKKLGDNAQASLKKSLDGLT